MALNEKYTLTFSSDSKIYYKAEEDELWEPAWYRLVILQEAFPGEAIEIKGGEPPITITWKSAGREENFLDPIIGSSADIDLILDTDEFRLIDPYEYQVRLYRIDKSKIPEEQELWRGWIIQKNYTEEFLSLVQERKLFAVDGLGSLKNIPYNYDGTPGLLNRYFISFKNVIERIVPETKLDLPRVYVTPYTTANNQTALDGLIIHGNIFENNEGEVKTAYEVLSSILQHIEGRIFLSHRHGGLAFVITRAITQLSGDGAKVYHHNIDTNEESTFNLIDEQNEVRIYPPPNKFIRRQETYIKSQLLIDPNVNNNPPAPQESAWKLTESTVKTTDYIKAGRYAIKNQSYAGEDDNTIVFWQESDLRFIVNGKGKLEFSVLHTSSQVQEIKYSLAIRSFTPDIVRHFKQKNTDTNTPASWETTPQYNILSTSLGNLSDEGWNTFEIDVPIENPLGFTFPSPTFPASYSFILVFYKPRATGIQIPAIYFDEFRFTIDDIERASQFTRILGDTYFALAPDPKIDEPKEVTLHFYNPFNETEDFVQELLQIDENKIYLFNIIYGEITEGNFVGTTPNIFNRLFNFWTGKPGPVVLSNIRRGIGDSIAIYILTVSIPAQKNTDNETLFTINDILKFTGAKSPIGEKELVIDAIDFDPKYNEFTITCHSFKIEESIDYDIVGDPFGGLFPSVPPE